MEKLNSLIVRAVNQCGRDPGKMKKTIVELAVENKDVDLLVELLEEILPRMIDQFLAAEHGKERRTILRSVAATPRGETVTGILRAYERSMLDFPLSDGRPVREATKGDLAANSAARMARGRTEVVTALWLRAAADALPDGTRAGEYWRDDAQLVEFKNLAERRVEAATRRRIGGPR